MEAIINKLELKKMLGKYYIKIELKDINGKIRTIDNPFLNDEINFRKQIFGIMSACDTFDLMKLGTNNPYLKKIKGIYSMDRLKMLENEKGECFYFSEERKEYVLDKTSKMKEMMDVIINNNLSKIIKEDGFIERIESQSGTFLISFSNEALLSYFVARQIYWGFGYPLNIGNEENLKEAKKASHVFVSFIVNLMKLYGISDLLDFGKNKDNLPIVEIEIDNKNNIVSMTNPNTGMGLSISKRYDIINTFDLDKQKIM